MLSSEDFIQKKFAVQNLKRWIVLVGCPSSHELSPMKCHLAGNYINVKVTTLSSKLISGKAVKSSNAMIIISVSSEVNGGIKKEK